MRAIDKTTKVPRMTGWGGVLAKFLLVVLVCASAVLVGEMLRPDAYRKAGEIIVTHGSGVALALSLVFGYRYWPAVFLGSVAGVVVVGFLTLESFSLTPAMVVVAATFTAQSYLSARMLETAFGRPVRFCGPRNVAQAFLLCGPVFCAVTPTIGLQLMSGSSAFSINQSVGFWLSWWLQEILGVALALPLILLWPLKSPSLLSCKGVPVQRFSRSSFGYIVFALLVSLAMWFFVRDNAIKHFRTQFENIVTDSTQGLKHRLDAYRIGLSGGAGLIGSSSSVNAHEWNRFVSTLDIAHLLPGANGVGFIEPVKRGAVDEFLRDTKLLDGPDIVVHPETSLPELFVIKYIEPYDANAAASGLDIAFEANRREAAIAARDSGNVVITNKIELVQDARASAGFLVLKPVYHHSMTTRTVDERRRAFEGWVYIPLIASRFMDPVSAPHKSMINFSAFDDPDMSPSSLIYTDAPKSSFQRAPLFTAVTTFPVFGKTWTIVWTTTPEFEAAVLQSSGARNVLIVGIAFTLLLALYLTSLSRREENIRRTVAERTAELAMMNKENSAIIETAVVEIALLDRSGLILKPNEAMIRLFGYGYGELFQAPISKLLGGQLDTYLRSAREAVGDLPPFRGELEARSSAGEPFLLDVQVAPWLTDQGVRRFTLIMRNITDKKRIERLLIETQNRLEVALTGAKIGIFDVDLVSGLSVVSNTWKMLFGFSEADDVDAQREFLKRIHPDDRAAVELADHNCIIGASERSVTEYRMRTRNGGWCWMSSNAVVAERDASGRALRLVGVQMDITELVENRQKLRQSEERLRSAIEYAPIGMAVVNGAGGFDRINAAFAAFFGRTEEDLMHLGFRGLMEAIDRIGLHREILALADDANANLHREITLSGGSDHEVWGMLNAAALQDEDDSTGRSFVLQVQDITQQRKLERVKSEFVATVSHELRTPLTSIKGALGLVFNAFSADIPEKVMRLLSIAHSNTERLAALVDEILDMEKITLGELDFSISSVNVSDLVKSVLESTRLFAQRYGVEYRLSVESDTMSALADPKRFQQVATNLLTNAAKFATESSVVDVRIESVGTELLILVTNVGVGIPKNATDKIFKPFSQVDSSSTRAKDGTGLGLYIAMKIVQKMGGKMGFESRPGQTTTFWFTVPADNTPANAAPLLLRKVATGGR